MFPDFIYEEAEEGKKSRSCSNNRKRVGNREKDKAEGEKRTNKQSPNIKNGGSEMKVCGISEVEPPINQTL